MYGDAYERQFIIIGQKNIGNWYKFFMKIVHYKDGHFIVGIEVQKRKKK